MTYIEMLDFTKKTVLHYLPQIVKAEESGSPYPEDLTNIAYGLPPTVCALFVTTLREKYQIKISL